MKNKVELKKYLNKVLLISLCIIFLFLVLNIYEYHEYTKNFNNKINNIINVLQNKYPKLSEKEIIEILNNKDNNKSKTLEKYGISLNNKAIVIENDEKYHQYLIINMTILILSIFILIIVFLKYLKKREKDINDITKYIEEINRKNYSLKIDSNSEDELSILKNEICKTTVMLKELADNETKDKINLKKSLEDISHQIKTPLTSILIMLDNLIDDYDMDKKTREDFIIDIKRNVININFLIESILKLSRFDANTINFIKEEKLLKDILIEVIKNVSPLCDLKNIKINITEAKTIKIMCDFNWEIEAITNILKNSLEYSYLNSKIDIFCEQNNAYSMITIKDYGRGIDKKDIKHIFERFYKGENSTKDSVGIGLALAKTIIENDNGTVDVKSDKNGTRFIIKYFKL